MSLLLQERKLRYKSVSTLPKVLQRADGGAKIQPTAAPEQMLSHTPPFILKEPSAMKKENSIYSTIIYPTLRIQTLHQMSMGGCW